MYFQSVCNHRIEPYIRFTCGTLQRLTLALMPHVSVVFIHVNRQNSMDVMPEVEV
jgi:hypothetical protein